MLIKNSRRIGKPSFVTVQDLAVALSMSVKSLRRAYWKGKIPFIRIGRLVRFEAEEVKHALEGGKHEAFRRRIAAALEGGTPGGDSRRRARTISPRSVTRGH